MSREIKNAVIKGARINDGDRGLLTAWLDLDYGGTCQSFGGFSLYLPKGYKFHELQSCAGHFIYRCMEIAEVSSWDKIVGKTIRVECEWDKIHAIGHIIKEDWFNPSKDFEASK